MDSYATNPVSEKERQYSGFAFHHHVDWNVFGAKVKAVRNRREDFSQTEKAVFLSTLEDIYQRLPVVGSPGT
jgi:hypothetical protein